MATKLLLVEDVDSLGRKGDIVSVKPGYSRNYLIPKGKAVAATAQALAFQERLKAERHQQALKDKSEAEALAASLESLFITTKAKVDHEGRMYGSVSVHDIVDLLQQQHNVVLERRSVLLKNPIKEVGDHLITLKLKEGVPAVLKLLIVSEG